MRLLARYAKDLEFEFEIVDVYENEIKRVKVSKDEAQIQTITNTHPSAIWFERKISDDFGIKFVNAFDKRSLIHQERFPLNTHPMLKSFTKKELEFDEYRAYEYESINGDGVFQVSVGPIHAGIIEPGHFHFSQAGEDMLHQEIRHFYKYRAIEKMLEDKNIFQAKDIIQRISGNESVAYQIAYTNILTQAGGVDIPLNLQKQYAIFLEIERIIHHLTDIGFIPNDAGFGSALAFASKLSEDARRVMKTLSNHRFGFDCISLKSQDINKEYLISWLEGLKKDIDFFEDWIYAIPSLWDRFDTTGILLNTKAIKYDTVGVVARASGVNNDVRENEFYKNYGFEVAIQTSGDVSARFSVRLKEIKNSLVMIKNFLEDMSLESLEIQNINDGEYFSKVESSIGELFMSIDIKDGLIKRFFVRDPSFVNWQAVHLMMPGNIIADFPLINKSCDLSYAGNDL